MVRGVSMARNANGHRSCWIGGCREWEERGGCCKRILHMVSKVNQLGIHQAYIPAVGIINGCSHRSGRFGCISAVVIDGSKGKRLVSDAAGCANG